jgi:hypothetical protein
MTATQLTLIWILLGCLIIWMMFFALLALRPEKSPSEDKLAASATHLRATTPTPAMLHVLTTTPTPPRQISTGQLQQEVEDPHSIPISL